MLVVVWALTTLRQVTEYGRALDDLFTVAAEELLRLMAAVQDPNPVAFRDSLLEYFPELASQYTSSAAQLSAAWYEEARREAVGGEYFARTSAGPTADRIDALVRYSVAPLFGQSNSTVMSLMGGGFQRMIADSGRDTTILNVSNDRISVGWQRVPRPGCCAFCAMLAGRGPVYRSEASSGSVVGRGVDAAVTAGRRGGQGRGVNPRGSQTLGDKFHDYCRCVVAQVFVGDSWSKQVQRQYAELYVPAAPEGSRVPTARASAAAMRREHGLR